MTNFPNGVASFGMPVIPSQVEQARTGRVYWVSNNTVTPRSDVKVGQDMAQPAGGTFNRPFATLAYAVTQCRANAGDTIIVKEGHAEDIAATDLAIATGGITIIGLGVGNNRPTFTHQAAGSTVNITAAGVELRNLRFVASFADVTAAITLATAGQRTRLINLDFSDEAADLNYVNLVALGAANIADGLYVSGLKWVSVDTVCGAALVTAAAQDNLTVVESSVFHAGITAAILAAGANNITNLFIDNCRTRTLLVTTNGAGGIVVSNSATASSGLITRVFAECSDASGSVIIPAASKVTCGGCFLSGVPGEYMTAGPAGTAAIGTQFNNT